MRHELMNLHGMAMEKTQLFAIAFLPCLAIHASKSLKVTGAMVSWTWQVGHFGICHQRLEQKAGPETH